MIGYCLANNLTMDVVLDRTGYLYIVQPEKYIGTDVYKYGITWNTKRRFWKFGGDKCKVFHVEKVEDMYKAELALHAQVEEYVDDRLIKIVPGTNF